MSAHASQIRPLKAWQIRTPQSTIRNPQLKGRADMLAMLFYAEWDTDEQPRPSAPSRAEQFRAEMRIW
jgi:hypothetical protein